MKKIFYILLLNIICVNFVSSQTPLYTSTKTFSSAWSINWSVPIGFYKLKVSGTYGDGVWNGMPIFLDAAFDYRTLPANPYNTCNLTTQSRWRFVDDCNIRPVIDVYNPSHIYEYVFFNSDGNVNLDFNDQALGDNSGSLTYELYISSPPCNPTASNTILTIPSTSLPFNWNGLTFNNSGSQTATLTNAKGCDSTATLNLTVINTALPSYLPANGLVGWWPFNGNANDESGNGKNGIVSNTTLTFDRFLASSSAYSFNGSTSYIGVPLINASGGNKLTISVWVNPADITSNLHYHIMRQDNGTSSLDWLLAFQNYGTILSFGLYPSGVYSELDVPISASNYTNSWHNITAVYNGTSRSIYRDGILIGSDSINGNVSYTPNATFAFGAAAANTGAAEKFNGKIDDVGIWNRALTQTEITELYSSSKNTIKLNLTTFLEGSYADSSSMTATANKINAAIPSSIADSIIVELHASTSPYATMYSSKGVVNTNGTASISFPNSTLDSSYYIVIKHRNSIETWSATPVTISNHTIYNFTTDASQAYGANLSNLGKGVFGIYSGDINQDGSIDFNDYPELDIASHLGVLGYDVNDLNGDASVDFNDFPILDVNSNYGIIVVRP